MQLLFLTPLILTITVFSADTKESLLERYQVARDSVINQRGFATGDLEVINSLCNELRASNASNSNNDANTLAAELQLTLWLDEDDRADELFRLIIALQPDDPTIGLTWSKFALQRPDADSEAIFGALLEMYPTSPEVVLDRAAQLDLQNRFPEALRVLKGLGSEELSKPDAAVLVADLLYADNRFDDAIAVLDGVDNTSLENNPAQKVSIDSRRTRFEEIAAKWETELAIRETEATIDDLPRVQLITSKGPILLELFEDHAPNTVANFISLAESGYYDGTRFHRIRPKFMAQGGDPNSREGASGQAGSGGPGYNIKDEHKLDDIRYHFAGSLSMANTGAPNSGGSQFFLTHLPTAHLNGRHTVFGRIVNGLNIARAIEKDDDIVTMVVIRKRDHEYLPDKLGPDGNPLVESTIEDTIETSNEPPAKTRKPTLTPSLNP